jgi:acetyltransferase
VTETATPVSATDEFETHPLRPLFAPAGVVVVGASSAPHKLGGMMAASLASYGGHVALVNPRGKGMHATVTSAAETAPNGIDLAVLCVPAAACPGVVSECGRAGVRVAMVCAGGFAEAGGAGAEHQRRLLAAAAEHGVRLLGPNTSGFFVPATGLLASFVPGVATLEPGPVGVVAASGGLNHALAFALQRQGCGLSLGVGIGAGVDIATAEALDYVAHDPGSRAIALHLETINDGPALLAAVRRATRLKPVVAMVVGQHDISAFAQSHTGSLATSWRTARALLRQAGAVVVDDVDALVVAAAVLATVRAEPTAAPTAALVTAQAGPGLVIADALRGAGIPLPPLGAGTREAVAALLPPTTYQVNPVDTGRPGPGHADVVSAVAADTGIDLVALYALTEPVVDLIESVRPARTSGHPVVVGIDGPTADIETARAKAAAADVPLVVGPRALATALWAVAEDARNFAVDNGAAASRGSTGPVPLPADACEAAVKDLLDALGVETPARRVCRSRQQVQTALAEIGGPVAVKVSAATILHKSALGGVRLGIDNPADLQAAFDDLANLATGEVLVEQMVAPGVDLIVAARRDLVFGPVVMVGVGGTATDLYADVALASIPCSHAHLVTLADTLKSRALLNGHRGTPPVDRDALAEVLAALGEVLLDHPDVAEFEINPLRAGAEGLIALDAVLVRSKEE